jgi:Domain of unknown function (DUF4926)
MATPLPINELDTVVLKVALAEERLDVGALGTVVGVHDDGETLEVEFANADGTASTRVRLPHGQVRRSTHEDA